MKFLLVSLLATCVSVTLSIPESKDLTPSGAWCWFGDPRAVHHENTTYVGFIDTFGNITVTAYNHNTKQVTRSTLKQNWTKDDHNNPIIHIRPDKHIFVFWSWHAGPGMFYRRSVRPLDISEWESEQKIPTNSKGHMGFTYPNPVELPDEGKDLYLFWRGGNFNPTWSVLSDKTKKWLPAKTLVYVPNQRPYIKIRGNDKDKIDFAFTEAHPRNMVTSIYHMYYKAGKLYKTNGTEIGPIGQEIAPQQATMIYNATKTGIRAWVHDIALEPITGHPVVTFAAIFNISYHRYHYAKWDGEKWLDIDLINAGGTISEDPSEPQYSGGITLDPDDPKLVYLSRDVLGNNIHEIERWTRLDAAGTRWTTDPITKNSTEQNVRPYSPRGLKPENGPMSIVWMTGRYPSYTKFQTRIKYIS